MNKEDIQRMLTLVDDRYLDEAQDWQPQRRKWPRWAALAACLCLVVGLGGFALSQWRVGGANSSGGLDSSGGSDDGPTSFSSYAGPVLQLTLGEETDAVAARRQLTYGLTPGVWRQDLEVTDGYALTNSSEEDVTLTVYYPFVDTLYDLTTPSLTLDGEELEASDPLVGTVIWHQATEGDLGGNYASEWEDYQAALEDGSYLAEAIAGVGELTGTVTVYWLQNADCSAAEGENPTLQFSATIDPEATACFSYGMNGSRWNNETGIFGSSFSVDEDDLTNGNLHCVILWGEDVTDYTLQGYENGGCYEGMETEVTATVLREETTWAELLPRLLEDYFSRDPLESDATEEMVAEAAAQWITENRWAVGMLDYDGISEILSGARVFWLEAEVTVPAGETVTLEAHLTQTASYNYTDYSDSLLGFDLLLGAGSNLTVTETAVTLATLDDDQDWALYAQNYGFDLENGVSTVTLEGEEVHYYLELNP
ncbi:MAG: hypothetical protein LUF28_08850 [Clostridiales bacterium]|nr:hypothetical protein [Clostridiales bacterium]